MRKQLLSLVLALAACLSLTVTAHAAATFSDLPSSHWAYSEIQKCCELGIVNGYPDGTFKPADSVTGAQFAAMLTRTFCPAELTANNSLSSAGWYVPALTTAYNANMLSGTSSLAGGNSDRWKTSANLPLTRYDMAQILNNILVSNGVTVSASQQSAAKSAIKDWNSVPSQYQTAVMNCYAAGILNGMSDGSFSGGGTINRSQACVVINRESQHTKGGSLTPATSTTPTATSTPASTTEKLDFSDSYKSSKYYTALQNVTLTGDYRQDIMNIAASQIGYCESNSETKLDGSTPGNGNYSEYGRALNSNGSAWCSEFASWCIRQANVPTDIIRSSRSASVSNFNAPYHTWAETSYAGGSYTPKPGDLALFAWNGTSMDGPYLSHTAIVSGVRQEGNTVYLSVIHGNANDSVRRDVYTLQVSDGYCGKGKVGYFVAPDYGFSSVQNYEPPQVEKIPDPEPVITLSQTTLSLSVGKTASLTAVTNQSSAAVTYTSSDSTVAVVSQSGVITPKKAGTAVITASVTVSGKKATALCVVTITETAAELKMSPETLTLTVGETGNVKAVLSGGTAAVSYSSSSQTVAAVDAAGKVTAKAAGTAVITVTATVGGKTVTAKCAVTVTAAQISKTPQELAAEVVALVNQERAKQGLSALGTFDTLTAAAEIRAPEVARVFSHTRPDGSECFTALKEANVTGYYTAGENIAAGASTAEAVMQMWMNSSGHKANILQKNFTHIGVAYYNGSWVQMFVGARTVSETPKEISVTMTPAELELETGKTGTVRATASNTTSQLTYTSSNPAVAVVSSSGLVTAKSTGTTVITAAVTANGKTYSAQCAVTVKETAAVEPEVSIQFESDTLTIDTWDSVRAAATVSGGYGKISYSTSDSTVATVDSFGNVTGKKGGTVTLTASATVNGKVYTAQCTVTVTPPEPPKTSDQLADEVITLVNQERAGQGLPALGTFDTLTAAAKIRAPEVARVFSHTRPDGSECFTALKEANVTGYYTAGENIAVGASTAEAVMQMWMNSSGHRANILQKNFTHIGVACYNGSWVQMFIGSSGNQSSTGGNQSSGNQTGNETTTQVNNPGRAQAIRSPLPENKITNHYRESWSNGDYFDLAVSGDTITFTGRYTTSDDYKSMLLTTYGAGGPDSTSFVSGKDFSLSIQIDMSYLASCTAGQRSNTIFVAGISRNYTPNAMSYSMESYSAARDFFLALDDNNNLAIYVS